MQKVQSKTKCFQIQEIKTLQQEHLFLRLLRELTRGNINKRMVEACAVPWKSWNWSNLRPHQIQSKYLWLWLENDGYIGFATPFAEWSKQFNARCFSKTHTTLINWDPLLYLTTFPAQIVENRGAMWQS